MLKNTGNRTFFILWIVLTLFFSLLPLHSIGYLFFLVGAAKYLRVLRAFDSYFANFVLAFMILVASIALSGIFTSYLNIPNYAIVNSFFALLFSVTIIYFQPPESSTDRKNLPVFNRSDIIGIAASILVPLLIVVVHLSSNGIQGALFRIVNADGWDNTSHLNLIQATSVNENYFYSISPLRQDDQEFFNNYPQGWHLATSSIADGIMPNIFNPSTYGLIATLTAYLVTVFLWYFITCYTVIKFAWSLLPQTTKWLQRGVLMTISVHLPVLVLFLTSLTSGYINYLAIMPMLLVVVMLSHQIINGDKKNLWPYLVIAPLLTVGIGLIWVLPLLPLALLILTTLGIVGINKQDIAYDKLLLLLSIALASVAFLLYAILLVKNIGAGQLFEGHGYIKNFPPPLTIALFGAFLYAAYSIRNKLNDAKLMFILASPFVLLVFGVWLLSYLHSGELSYYGAKTLGLLCVVLSVFVTANIVWISEHVFKTKYVGMLGSICIATSLIGLSIITSGQNIDLRMLQKNQYILNPTERSFVSKWMYSDEALNKKEQLLLVRENITTAPGSAMLFNRTTPDSAIHYLAAASPRKTIDIRSSDTCLLYFYYDGDNMQILPSDKPIFDALSQCLAKRKDANVKTKLLLPYSVKQEYDKIKTYDAELIYY